MSAKPPKLQCSKCAAPSSPEAVKCAQCGGRIIKVCGACGFQNSPAKKFCDTCGEPQTPGEPAKAAPARQEPPAAQKPAPAPPSELDLPKTKIVSLPSSFVGSTKPPVPTPQKAPASAPAPKPKQEAKPAASPSKRPIASTVLGAVLLAAGGIFYGLYRRHRVAPQALLVQAAQGYLAALKTHDYAAAYSMLSKESRGHCSLEEFRRSQDPSNWDFEDIDVSEYAEDRALVLYTLRAPPKEPGRDWLRFYWEDGKWVRGYWWNLSRTIEDALQNRDPDSALASAAAAVRIDPYDPMARSYLCEAAYARGDSARVESECLRSLDLAKEFPSDMTDKGLYHVHAILADLYKNRLARYPEAARHFDILLALPGLDAPQQCDAYLARAETRHLMADDPGALADVRDAGKICSDPAALEFQRRAARILGGLAGKDAVAVLQYQHMPDGNLTYEEWRDKETTDRAGRETSAQASEASTRGAEAWIPEYLGGSLYKVSLRNSRMEILTAQVDLWTRKVKVDIHVQ